MGYLFVAPNLDPHQGLHIGHWPSTSPFWDRLFEVDGDHQVNAGLAEEWGFDEAGTTLTITMRAGSRSTTARR